MRRRRRPRSRRRRKATAPSAPASRRSSRHAPRARRGSSSSGTPSVGRADLLQAFCELPRRAARRVRLRGARIVDHLPRLEPPAASAAKRSSSAAPSEKLPDAITPTSTVSRQRVDVGVSPPPMMPARPDDDADSPLDRGADVLLDHGGMGVVDDDVRRRRRRAPPRPTRSSRGSERETPETSARSFAASTASATARPVQPVIPATQTRVTSLRLHVVDVAAHVGRRLRVRLAERLLHRVQVVLRPGREVVVDGAEELERARRSGCPRSTACRRR